MKIVKPNGFKTLIVGLLVAAMCCGCGNSDTPSTEAPSTDPVETVYTEPVSVKPVGYKSAISFGEGFLACGTGGRVDSIATDGTVTPCVTGTAEDLNYIYAKGISIVACGEKGTVILSADGGKTFRSIGPDTEDTLSAAAIYNGTVFIAGQKGVIYQQDGDSWKKLQMETDKDLIGLVVTNQGMAAISAESDVCFTEDGVEWDYENFNEVYEGMYPTYVFTRLVSGVESFFVLGYEAEHPNRPLVMYTSMTDMNGDVWMQREMRKINGEYVSDEMNLPIHDISFNADQIVAPMDDGVVLAITDCTECNETKIMEGAGDLWATASRGDAVLLCGEDFYAQVLSNKQIRQDKIAAEKAKDDLDYGAALLIDVREADELAADGYIPGSIHVPLAEVEERLPELASDFNQEIIFYCASGMRSQKATELAVDMGYVSVYNLGGLKDWPYEIVKD